MEITKEMDEAMSDSENSGLIDDELERLGLLDTLEPPGGEEDTGRGGLSRKNKVSSSTGGGGFKPASRPRRTSRKDSRGSYEDYEELQFSVPDYVEEGFKAAQRAGFNPIEMMPEERTFFPAYVDYNQPRYLDLRNTILYKWKSNVHTYLSKEQAQENIKDELRQEIEPIWDFLTRYGHINSGIFKGSENKIVQWTDGISPRVVVIGAGAAGLVCAQQLKQWGYKVTVIEARSRIGGRCNTSTTLDSSFSVDLGASIITGLIGNPLDNITQQLQLRTHPIGSNAYMLTDTGHKVDKDLDARMDGLFNSLLENAASFKDTKSPDKSLGLEMEKILPRLSLEESGTLDWYYANLEYACAADLSLLSLNYWDQDDPFDFSGEHLMLVDGYGSMLGPLTQGLDIRLDHKVTKVTTDLSGVTITTDDGTNFEGDVALITLPLGVLKTDMVTFEPPLPPRKKESIKNLGFGLLNKVAILFDQKFWEDDIDWFGKVITHNARESRGLCYLWWNYFKVVQQPLLVAIVAGKACHAIELRTDEDIMTEVTGFLRGMFNLRELPRIVKHVITRWKSDQFAGGSYSYVALGATGDDYDTLAKTVQLFGKNRLYFGGEHTCRQHPATVAGAYASGLREAEKIHRSFYPPINPTFIPPSIINEIDKTREANRKKMVKKTEKVIKSRIRAQFRRGIRHLSIPKSGNELYKFSYQYLYGKKDPNTPRMSDSGTIPQFQTYDALLNKKRRKEEVENPSNRRKVVQTTQDGRVWYAPVLNPAYSNTTSQNNTQFTDNNDNNTTTSTTNDYNTTTDNRNSTTTSANGSQENNSNTAIYLGTDNSLLINPYGTFQGKAKPNDKSPNSDDDGKPESKMRHQYRSQVAKYVVHRLSRYYKNKRITNRDDFKHLSRKFTHKFITWEDNHAGTFKMDPKKKEKMKKIIDDYFQRHNVYSRKAKSTTGGGGGGTTTKKSSKSQKKKIIFL